MQVDWNTYFLSLAFLIANKSKDITKHGSVIVDKNHVIQTVGFNGAPMGFDDSQIDYTSSKKYPVMVHAEINSIIFAQKPLIDCTLYCTGRCCSNCLKHIAQTGIKKIICGKVKSRMVDINDLEISNLIAKECGIEIIDHDCSGILEYFDKTINYIKERNN